MGFGSSVTGGFSSGLFVSSAGGGLSGFGSSGTGSGSGSGSGSYSGASGVTTGSVSSTNSTSSSCTIVAFSGSLYPRPDRLV